MLPAWMLPLVFGMGCANDEPKTRPVLSHSTTPTETEPTKPEPTEPTPTETTPTETTPTTEELEPLGICINELMPDNDSSHEVDGEFPDWIELFNPTDEAVDLTGWALSDDRDEPDKHLLPEGLELPPGEALLLYADSAPELGAEHLSFSLEVDGEEIVLMAPDGRTSIVVFGPLTGDVSALRETDCCFGAECWLYRFAGTPGEANIVPEVVERTLFEAGGTWLVYDEGTQPAPGWRESGFDDSGWWSGTAPLGYGDPHIATEVSHGPDPRSKYITSYFRTTFEAAGDSDPSALVVELLRDDGAAVSLNGVEIARSNLPLGELSYDTLATETASDSGETSFHRFSLDADQAAGILVTGTNTLAVEVHQVDPTSSDQGMDVRLIAEELVYPETILSDSAAMVVIEEIEGLPDPSAFLFTRDRIHAIALEIPDASIFALERDPYTYQPAAITLDGQEVGLVGVRIRGKYGSYRDIYDKPKLKIDFNRFVDNQRFFGLESLSVNNSVVDCSYLKEAVSYRGFAEAGLPTPRLAFTDITVNGEDYGLYQLVESQDDVWLERHWADPSGNLYDGKYAYEWPWIWIGFVDFWPAMVDLFQLEEGTDVALEDVKAISAVNMRYGETESYYEEMGQHLDWEQWHRHMAAEQWTGHIDGYWLNTNNYRVYFDPEDGLAEFVTWDLDYSILDEQDWGMSFDSPSGIIASFCRHDAACWAAQRDAAQWLVSTIDTASMEAEYDALLALIEDRSITAPGSDCSTGAIRTQQRIVRSWISNRNQEVSRYWEF